MSDAVIFELRRIYDENGGVLKPDAVVEAARPENSPLHSRFTWDDNEAANQYRLWQARQLIRVSVELIDIGHKEPVEVRAFVSLTPDREEEGGGYRRTVEVLSRAETRKQLLNDAVKELGEFEQKYKTLSELAEVFAASRKLRRQVA